VCVVRITIRTQLRKTDGAGWILAPNSNFWRGSKEVQYGHPTPPRRGSLWVSILASAGERQRLLKCSRGGIAAVALKQSSFGRES
jgi:hypothetical protein